MVWTFSFFFYSITTSHEQTLDRVATSKGYVGGGFISDNQVRSWCVREDTKEMLCKDGILQSSLRKC